MMSPSPVASMGFSCMRNKPIRHIGMETKKPASGPAIPMSMRAFLSGIGSLIEITAPKVPKGKIGFGGTGMKKGREAATPCFLETK